jgi:uncharacterized linocin/CFP29 family protein
MDRQVWSARVVGGWGKNSEGSPAKSPQKDVINQAEQAYAELKKAGYKGPYSILCCMDRQVWSARVVLTPRPSV